jgi:hypothetical protein
MLRVITFSDRIGRIALQKQEQTMSKCGAGDCSCECGGNKGCGCIASSDFPDQCECHCYGAAFGGGLTLGLNAYVDVTISGLPLLDAARFLNSVHSGRVLVPAAILTKLNKRVRLKVKRQRFADVLDRLGLAAGRNPKKRKKRK